MNILHRLFLLLVLSTCLMACNNDPDPDPVVSYTNGFYVINEGTFGTGNASVSFYDATEAVVHEEIFQTKNELPLGDVGQSMTLINDQAWVVVNNSNKIEVVDADEFTSVGQVTGLTSPRHVLPLGDGRAYVSDLFSGAISIVNTTTFAVEGSIDVGAWTESMVMAEGKVFVAVSGRSSVWVIDPGTDAMIDTINVFREPNSMVVDKNGMLWVLCTGGWEEEIPRLVGIETASNAPVLFKSFASITEYPSELRIDAAGVTLYYLNWHVYRMNIADADLPTEPFIDGSMNSWYAMSIHPETGDIYLSDAVDWVQKGSIHWFNAAAEEVGSAPAGIAPGEIVFR